MSELLESMIISFFWVFHNYSSVARLVKRSVSTVQIFLNRASEQGHIQNPNGSAGLSTVTVHDKSSIKHH